MSPYTVNPMLEFNADLHEYWLHGKKLRSVTGILDDAGQIDGTWHSEEARDRGTAVHAAIHYFNEGDLDELTLEPRVAGRFRGYLKFRERLDFQPIHNEFAMADEALEFAGTCDTLGFVHGGSKLIEADFKNGVPCEWHALQLAAYAHLTLKNRELLSLTLREALGMDLWAVYLQDDDYRIEVVPKGFIREKRLFLPRPAAHAKFMECYERTKADGQEALAINH